MQTTQSILKWRRGEACEQAIDHLAAEEPMEIRVRGRSVSVTMRTPAPGTAQDEELAAGFLLTEGLIHRHADIHRIEPCGRDTEGNVVNVFLTPGVSVDFDQLTRHVFASSSCGLCGKASIESVHLRFEPIHAEESVGRIEAERLAQWPNRLRDEQPTFTRTGGLHAAALFDSDGRLVVCREDIGRHNAVDKVLGYALLHDRLPLHDHVLLVSGRASFEIVQKALAGRIPVVAAVSAPSSLAVEFARDSGQTLVGFLRDGRMNLYTHPHRILTEPSHG